MGSYVFFSDRPLEKYHKSDFLFLLSTILLLGLGIFTLYFASQNTAGKMFNDPLYFVKRQMTYVLFGIVLFIIFASLRMALIKKILRYIIGLAILLSVMVHIPGIGIEKNDAMRWIRMPFNFTFQPSELVKFAIVLFLANYFDKEAAIENPDEKTLWPCVLGMFLILATVLAQKDFSTTVFIFAVCMIMFIASGTKLRWFILVAPIVIICVLIFILNEEYRIERVIGFIHPLENGETINYQPNLSKRAVSTGSFWGTGIGSGLNVSMRVPEVQSDYIFAAWTEAMGLFGVIVYFIILGVFAWRGYRTALICKNRFAAYGSFGFVTMILLQSLLNCAVVCGSLPSTGIPLPFFSLGGSSIVLSLAMCGFIINASRFDTENDIVNENNVVEINSFSGVNVYE